MTVDEIKQVFDAEARMLQAEKSNYKGFNKEKYAEAVMKYYNGEH